MLSSVRYFNLTLYFRWTFVVHEYFLDIQTGPNIPSIGHLNVLYSYLLFNGPLLVIHMYVCPTLFLKKSGIFEFYLSILTKSFT